MNLIMLDIIYAQLCDSSDLPSKHGLCENLSFDKRCIAFVFLVLVITDKW